MNKLSSKLQNKAEVEKNSVLFLVRENPSSQKRYKETCRKW